MNININTDVHNKYEFTLIHNDGTEEHQTAYNVVTNSYYNRIATGSGINFATLALGTGTGTISVTDTALFTRLYGKNMGWNISDIKFIRVGEYVETCTVTYTEDEAVGNITEIGIEGNGYLYSHALITDAEGHPISIAKTNTDRLIVTVTIYLTIQLPNNVVPDNGIGGIKFSNTGDQQITSVPRVEALASIVSFLSGATGLNYMNRLGLVLTPGGVTGCYKFNEADLAQKVATITTIQNGLRMTMSSRVLADDWNLPYTYQIYGINTWFGTIPITADIFPPAELTLTAAGDGTTKGFNFKVGELMSNPKVYINDVLQSTNSYTWNGIDYVNTYQTWETTRAEYNTTAPVITNWDRYYENKGTILFNTIINGPYSGTVWTTSNIEYDFGVSKTFTRAFKPTANTAWSDWEYSTDGTTWTTLTIPSSANKIYDFPTPLTARYLRALNAIGWSFWESNGEPKNHSHLCCYKDQLVFNTAPPDGSIIKIEAKTAYPIKNSNWIVDQLVIDLTIGRGS